VNAGPNPARGTLAIAFTLPVAGAAALDLFDVRGRRVLHRDLAALAAGAHSEELARGGLATGVYIVRLTQGARMAQRKVAMVR
jgi:hypothetical protein